MPSERDVGFEIRTLSNLIRRDVEKNIAAMDPKPNGRVHGWAINYFYENRDRDIFQKDFEEKFLIRRSTASNMLKLMEKDGYIKRVSVENDARLKKIVLTDKAIKTHTAICRDIAAREKRLRKGLTDEELEAFFRITEKLKKNMENAE